VEDSKLMNKTGNQIDIREVQVVPLFDYFEIADVETVLSRCHPLGWKKAIGNRMYYAAEHKGVWLGVLIFDSSVDRNKWRKSAIGWNTNQEKSRRKHVANNSRFCILPKYAGIKNLSSKILSLACERISEDWFKHYGIPLLAVETYVDPSYNNNQGSCYSASGWSKLGLSSGYVTGSGERTSGKWYFLKALHKDSYKALSSTIPHCLLTGVKPVSKKSNNNYVLEASKLNLKSLQQDLEKITEHRTYHIVYPLQPFLSLCVAAVLSGYTQYRQISDWISKLEPHERAQFGMPADRSPCESTVANFLSQIDPKQLNEILTKYLLKAYPDNYKIKTLALDGKELRAHCSDTKQRKSFLNVYATELGIVIGHIETKKGAGEKATARDFIEDSHNLEGVTILADAIHTDKKFVQSIEKKTPRMSSLLKTIKSF